MYRIVWTSTITGQKGYGSWMQEREEADAWVKAMNAQNHATRWSVEESHDADYIAAQVTEELLGRLMLRRHRV